MKVEPRVTFVGMSLKSVRLAAKELVRPGSRFDVGSFPTLGSAVLVLSFEGEGPAACLICQPEGNLVTPPDGGQPFVHITGVKYEIGTGDLAILADVQELAGEAAGVLGKIVTQTSHDARQGVFGVQLGPEPPSQIGYGIVITPAGMRVFYEKELACEFRKPLVTQ